MAQEYHRQTTGK